RRAADRVLGLISRIGELASSQNRRSAALGLVRLIVELSPATGAAAYILSGERSRQLMRAGVAGELPEGPSFCEEMELLTYAAEAKLTVVRLSVGAVQQGFLVVAGSAIEEPALWDLFVAQATTALALIGERVQSHRGAMKDPHSIAYTFAYFVDVAGREIDKAV